jgi:hypothetical protein
MGESPFTDCIIEGDVLYMAGLLHAIDALSKLHNPILFPGLLKAWGLFRVHRLIIRQYTMEKGRLDIELLDVSVERSTKV